MTLLLAIDGGGTRTRCIAVGRDGGIRGQGEAGPSNHLHVPMDVATAALRTATAAALSASGAAAADVALVSAGLAGVDFDGTGASDGAGMLRSIGFDRVAVYGDMVIAHRGALAGQAGVMALAGTGSSVLGIGNDGTMIKAGGWGPLYGDGGSAYQLGRLGLAAAAEAYDASGPMTSLLHAAPGRARSRRIPRHGEAALFGFVRAAARRGAGDESWTRAPKKGTRSQPESAGRPASISRGRSWR